MPSINDVSINLMTSGSIYLKEISNAMPVVNSFVSASYGNLPENDYSKIIFSDLIEYQVDHKKKFGHYSNNYPKDLIEHLDKINKNFSIRDIYIMNTKLKENINEE